VFHCNNRPSTAISSIAPSHIPYALHHILPTAPFVTFPFNFISPSLVSSVCIAEGVMMAAAVEKSYSDRTRSWNCL